MYRNIHLFRLKAGQSEERMFELIRGEWGNYLLSNGCIERRTMKLLDARGRSTEEHPYMSESLWPDLETPERINSEMPDDIRKLQDELFGMIDRASHLILRYTEA